MTSTSINERSVAAETWLHRHGAELPKFNARLAQAIANINWDSGDMHELERVISSDPAMIASTLRAANSPFFGLSKRVDSIRHALTVLGVSSVRSILMRGYLADAFGVAEGDSLAGELVNYSIICGLAARELASDFGGAHDAAFIAGVLLYVGKLLIALHAHAEADTIYEDGNYVIDHGDAEVFMLGFDHVDLALATLRTWNMPDTIVEPVYDCHRAQHRVTPLLRTLAAARRVADHMAYLHMGREADAAAAYAQLVALIGQVGADALFGKIRDEVDAMFAGVGAADGGMR